MKTPKVDQLRYKLFSRQSVSTTDILEARKEFYALSSKKASYLLRLRPSFYQRLLLIVYKLSASLDSWVYSFSLSRKVVVVILIHLEERCLYTIADEDLTLYNRLLEFIDHTENKLLEQALSKELDREHTKVR